MYLKYAHFQADFAVTENSSETSVNRNRSSIRQWCLSILQFTMYRVWNKITLHYCCESGHHVGNGGSKLQPSSCVQTLITAIHLRQNPAFSWEDYRKMFLPEVCPLVPRGWLWERLWAWGSSSKTGPEKRLIISCLDLIAFVWHCINSWAADKMPWLKIEIKWSAEMVCSL